MIAQEKREKLANNLPDNSLVILVGKSEQIRNGDVCYRFRQDSDVLLLTGLDIPDIILIGIKVHSQIEWRIYSDMISEKEQLWGTSRLPHDALTTISGISEVRERRYLNGDMKSILSGMDHIFERDTLTYSEEKTLLRRFRLTEYKDKIESLSPYLKPLRMYKTTEEVEQIRKAISITHQAYDLLSKNIRPGMYEYEIEAIVAGFYRANATVESYPTIVASGPNSCIMHYGEHTRRVEIGDQILIDFGAEYRGYSSDVTRVFFVGEPSKRQKEIYKSLVQIKSYAESLIGTIHSRHMHEDMVRVFLIEELMRLSLIDPKLSTEARYLLSKKYLPYRSLNHHLGLDTHDVGSKDDTIAAGMVITCEPGIYIREEGIGMRLEDDLLIIEGGYENLSKVIPIGL